jgi:hypothetical protein
LKLLLNFIFDYLSPFLVNIHELILTVICQELRLKSNVNIEVPSHIFVTELQQLQLQPKQQANSSAAAVGGQSTPVGADCGFRGLVLAVCKSTAYLQVSTAAQHEHDEQ